VRACPGGDGEDRSPRWRGDGLRPTPTEIGTRPISSAVMVVSSSEHRVIIESVRPTVECGRFPAKAAAGQSLEVSADIFADGHDQLMAVVRHGPPPRGRAAARREEVALQPVGNDHWRGLITPEQVGPWEFEVVGVADAYGSWARDLRLRIEAGQEVTVELEDGAQMVDRRLGQAGLRAAD